jgi:hypothetical protein
MSFNSNDDCGFGIIEPTAFYCSPTNEQEQCMEQQLCFEDAASTPAVKIFRSHGVDFVRQPCKARGIEIQCGQNPHVARFAYIDIPVATKHGTVLSCCHPVCIDSGRRFRYCIHCKTAVAKRNFNVRHAHGSLNSPPPKVDAAVSSPFESNNNQGQDVTATTVPSFISLDESSGAKDNTGSDSTMVSLTPKEAEIINILRFRPDGDHPTNLNQWQKNLLKMTEELTFQQSVAPPPTTTFENSSNNATDMPVTTSGDDDGASMTSFLDTEDFENFDSFVTDFFQDV